MEISVHPCDSDDVKQLLKEFGRLLVLLNQAKDQKLITITLKHIQFITPFLALFLSASINMIKNAGCEVHLEKPHNPDLISYLDTIYFETGVSFQTKEEVCHFWAPTRQNHFFLFYIFLLQKILYKQKSEIV